MADGLGLPALDGGGAAGAAAPSSPLSGDPSRYAGAVSVPRHAGTSTTVHVAPVKAPAPATHLTHTATSHTRLAPRLGASKLEFGVVTALDWVGYTATVRMLGASSNVIGPIPVSIAVLPSLVLNSVVMVLLVDENNPSDAIVVGSATGNVPLYVRAGQVTFAMAGAPQQSACLFSPPLPNSVLGVFASASVAGYLAQVTAGALTGLTVQCSVGVGGTPGASVVVSWLAIGL